MMGKISDIFKNKISKEFNKPIMKCFWINIILFIVLTIGSFIFYKMEPSYTLNKVKDIARSMGQGYNSVFLNIFGVFFNNLIVSIVGGILIGLIPFIFLPVVNVFINATSLGVVLALFSIKGYNSLVVCLISVLPHGIIEIPTILYAVSIGLVLCKNITLKIFSNREFNKREFFENIKNSLLFIIVPLLFLASIIENLITPWLMKFI